MSSFFELGLGRWKVGPAEVVVALGVVSVCAGPLMGAASSVLATGY